VSAVAAHNFPTLPTSTACFVRRPLMCCPFRVRGLPTLAGDIALTRGIHRSEPSLALPAHRPSHRQRSRVLRTGFQGIRSREFCRGPEPTVLIKLVHTLVILLQFGSHKNCELSTFFL
jgi:hypothetical protein